MVTDRLLEAAFLKLLMEQGRMRLSALTLNDTVFSLSI